MMNEYEMENVVKALSGDSSDYVTSYLNAAKAAVVSHLFPFDTDADWDDVPAKYHMRACEIAVYLIDKRGAEGQTQHIESDVSRIYGSDYIPDRMFSGMVPFCGVPK